MHTILAVGCGGFFGAIARYLISSWIMRQVGSQFPWGTLVVNVLGCFLIGILMQWALHREWFSPQMHMVFITGCLGSLTTFSTFGYETVALLEQGNLKGAVLSIALNLVLGLGAVMVGKLLVSTT